MIPRILGKTPRIRTDDCLLVVEPHQEIRFTKAANELILWFLRPGDAKHPYGIHITTRISNRRGRQGDVEYEENTA